jgi:hypothetical protein
MQKKSVNIQMSARVPDSEKRVAEQASESFGELTGKLKLAISHLNTVSTSFSSLQNPDSKEIMKHRVVLRNFRDQVKKNFEQIMTIANSSAVLMARFSSDPETIEIMNSFGSQVQDLEKQVNRFLALFSNIGDESFMPSVMAAIDLIKKQAAQVTQLINDRALEHIDTNILAKRWTSEIKDENNNNVYERLPLLVQLFNETKGNKN